MKVFIVEDDLIVADHLSMLLEKHHIQVLGAMDNVDEAIESTKLKPDFYFVDIRLEGSKSGIDFGFHLNQHHIPFVFLTANNEPHTTKKAIQAKPFAYISKPFKENDIIAAIELYKTSFGTQFINVRTNLGKRKLAFSELLFLRANGVYVELVTAKKTYLERESLSGYENILDKNFIRIHRSFIININQVDSHTASYVYIKGHKIPISRSYKLNVGLL